MRVIRILGTLEPGGTQGASRLWRSDGLAGPQQASPAWVGRLAPLDLVVVVAVLDHLALFVEARHHPPV